MALVDGQGRAVTIEAGTKIVWLADSQLFALFHPEEKPDGETRLFFQGAGRRDDKLAWKLERDEFLKLCKFLGHLYNLDPEMTLNDADRVMVVFQDKKAGLTPGFYLPAPNGGQVDLNTPTKLHAGDRIVLDQTNGFIAFYRDEKPLYLNGRPDEKIIVGVQGFHNFLHTAKMIGAAAGLFVKEIGENKPNIYTLEFRE